MISRPGARVAIAHPIMVLLGFFVIVGIIWIGLYYGGILPIYNSIVGTFGGAIFDSTVSTFVLTVCAFWVLILTLGGLYWLWQQSQKPEGY